MEGPSGRQFVTNQYAVLAHGKAEREFPFIACSDSAISEVCCVPGSIWLHYLANIYQHEFNRYRQTMAVEDCKMATKSMLADKVVDINRLLNHKFTNEELNEKLRKQGSLDSKTLIFKRMETEKQLKLAKASGDDEEVEALQAQLSQLGGPKPAFGMTPKPQGKKQSEHDRLAEINLRNQKLNYESVRRAQLEERKASKKAAAAVARGEAAADPFMRVRTLAKTHHDANGGSSVPEPKKDGAADNGNNTPTTGSDTPGKAIPTGSAAAKKPVKGGIAGIRHQNMDDENIAALDLDLDIEI